MKARNTKAGIAILTLALVFAMAAPAMAADSVTVNAEVDVDPYSIVLDEGAALDFGMLEVGDWSAPPLGTHVVVRNNGGSAVRLDVAGADAGNGSGGVWELDPLDNGADQFMWVLSGGYGGAWFDDATATLLASNLETGGSAVFDSMVAMPTSTTDYGTYSWTGTIYASAP